MMRITVLGSTGSIGANTLALARQHATRIEVHALTAHRNVDALARQVAEFRPAVAVISDASLEDRARAALRRAGVGNTSLLAGPEGLAEVAADRRCDAVVAGIVGAAGLSPVLAAATTGKRIVLANKESLVIAGPLFMETVRTAGATVIPVDSEHNAIFQCLPTGCQNLAQAGVIRLCLTASGGPFRRWTMAQMDHATPDQACAHPNWRMGRKISVDSATLMNKGLEVIEAHHLFAAAPEQIEVLVHPQSIVHGLVHYRDGSVLAQLGSPDMKTPLACGLFHPERGAADVRPLYLATIGRLEFETPDRTRFPCLTLAFEALQQGGDAAIWLNAANEVAVEAFLDGRIRFTHIAKINRQAMQQAATVTPDTLQSILQTDSLAREFARRQLESADPVQDAPD